MGRPISALRPRPSLAAQRADELLDTSSFDFLNLFLFMLQFMGQPRD